MKMACVSVRSTHHGIDKGQWLLIQLKKSIASTMSIASRIRHAAHMNTANVVKIGMGCRLKKVSKCTRFAGLEPDQRQAGKMGKPFGKSVPLRRTTEGTHIIRRKINMSII